jgi:transcriptional regulator with XRE-family HTH domain
MNLKDKLKAISDETPSKWLEESKQKLAKQGARRNARILALEILRILQERNLTQMELATEMGVSRQHISKIVKGQENFTFETIEKLEKALGTKLITVGEPKYHKVYAPEVATYNRKFKILIKEFKASFRNESKPLVSKIYSGKKHLSGPISSHSDSTKFPSQVEEEMLCYS